MLYRTVYGPELEAIYGFVATSGAAGVERDAVYAAFVPDFEINGQFSTQNIDDALAFLAAAHLTNQRDGQWTASPPLIAGAEFRIQVLAHLRHLQKEEFVARHPADPTYLLLLEELYVKPRERLVRRLLVRANGLADVQAIGGLNREKLQGWRRVMCYLGLGIQVQGEFVFAPDMELVMTLIRMGGMEEGSLQDLIERHLSRFIPCCDYAGGLTAALQDSFSMLQRAGRLQLYSQQDAPSRPYGPQHYRAFRVMPS